MKILIPNIVLFFISFASFTAYGQQPDNIDSLKNVLHEQKEDTNKVKTLYYLSISYRLYHPDSSLAYAQQALKLAEILHYEMGIFWSMTGICGASILVGNYLLELEYAFKAFSLSKKLNTPRVRGFGNGVMSDCYYNLGKYDSSLNYWREVMRIIEQWFPEEMYVAWGNLSRIYGGMNEPDSAILYAKKAYENINGDQRLNKYWQPRQVSATYTSLGDAFAGKAEYDSALFYYRTAISLSANNFWEVHLMNDYNGVAAVCKATGKLDSAVWYAKKALATNVAKSYPVSSLKATNLLSDVYDLKNRPDSTLKYLRMAVSLRETLFNRERMMAIQSLHHKEQERQKEIAESKSKLRDRFIMYFFLASFIAVLVIVSIVLRNKRQKQLQNMRNSIADDLHDDIGSTLSSISIMSELAKAKSPEASSLLASIGESTISIQENMSDIVWAIKSENDSFENVLQRMNQFASDILDAKNIALDFISDEALSISRLTMKQRKNLYLFFKEVINNAAKHSDAKKISVHIFPKGHHVEMIIKDNGKGFDTSQTFHGNGMSTLKKRADELQGYFNIQSQIKEGTVVELKFKIT
jgi:two-component system sensor histidine kinase UhpB